MRQICYSLCLPAVFLCTAVAVLADEPPLPPAADYALRTYEREVAAARDKAVRQLQTVLTDETKLGKLDSALAVRAAIEKLAPGKSAPAAPVAPAAPTTPAKTASLTPPAPPTPPPTGATVPFGSTDAKAKPTRTEIKANAKMGAELGPMTAGTRLTLQYVEGKWYRQVQNPDHLANPDEVKMSALTDNYGLSLAIFAVENGEATPLEIVPPGTKKKPFHYRFKKDYPMVILRIRDSLPGDNPGAATYDVTIEK